MKNYIFLFLQLLIFLFCQLKCYIVYPLKTLEEGINTMESLLSFNSTYTILEIGTPQQKVNFYFDITHSKINLTDKGCPNKNIYKRNNSSSFQIAFELEPSEQDNNTKYLVLDSLHFNNNLNLTKTLSISEYPFYYSANISQDDIYLCGNIGLSILQYDIYNSGSQQVKYYTDELKKLGASQDDDFSFLHYNNQDYLIYNVFLQSEFPDLFKGVENVSWLHPLMRAKTYELHWEISMKEIYYNNVHSKNFVTCEINPLFELILGTNDFKKNITNDFFNKYINSGICIMEEYKGYHVLGCNEGKFTNKDIKNFPTIYFSNLGLNHIFELTSGELFIKINNKWYFKIVFPVVDLDVERWILGRIFMRKYPVKFSPFSRLIGFYLKPNEGDTKIKNKSKEKKDEKNIYNKNISKNFFYIIIIIIALIFTGVGLYIGRKIFYPRKIRANELEDNYQYESKNNKEIKKDKEMKLYLIQ